MTTTTKFTSGAKCLPNRNCDIYFDYGCRQFLDKPCTIVKVTKSGLVQVSLDSNPKQTYSFPPRNIDLVEG